MRKNDGVNLPKRWEVRKLGEVLTIERGGSPRPIEKFLTDSPDGINWIKISDATASNKYIFETKEKINKESLHKTRIVHEGDFILSNSMSFGRPYIMKTTGCIHDGWLVLKQNGNKIFEAEFLYYLLSSPYVFTQFDYLAAGSTVRNLNIALVSSVQVPIPLLPEQRRIVSILDKCFAIIDKAKANAEQNLKNVREVFESYLQGVFGGGNWEMKTLNQISENLDSKRVPITKNKRQSGKIPYYGASGIVDYVADYIFNEDLLCISEDGANLLARTYPIAFSISGKTWVNNHAHVLRFPNLITQKFVELYINSIKIDGYVSGMAQPKLNQAMLNKIPIPYPPLSKQQSIVRQLDALRAETQRLEAVYRKKIIGLEELKKSILQKVFSGELTKKEK
ncbi:MAG: restriction endonuclease subunit S [Fibromonadaceae bacterium]|jgi:type I restriction enzyme S subunit|nr:restriction endonuclease subunit S [Fibromonadaceae bacterium]